MVNSVVSKKKLKTIYYSGKSMPETAKSLSISPSKVRYWMNKYKIKRRNHSDAAYIKQNPNGDPFVVKDKHSLNRSELFLYGLGIGLYWGEGNKANNCSSLRITNSDPGVIKTFISFLKFIYRLDDRRFSYSIVSFNDINPEDARAFWAKELGIYPYKFGKITVVPSQGNGTYKKKSRFGVCTVQGNNVKLRKIVLDEIEKLKRT